MSRCGADFDARCSGCGTGKWAVRAEVKGRCLCGMCLARGPRDGGYVRAETDLYLWQRVAARMAGLVR